MSARDELEAELERHRRSYRDGPVGVWLSFLDRDLGTGFDGAGLFGSRVEFRPDGTGELHSWGFRTDERLTFRWRASGPCQIAILLDEEDPEPAGPDREVEESLVSYEFFTDPEFGVVLMREAPQLAGSDSFWMVPGPVRLAESGG